MKDFILAALPFVIIGICLAIICAKFKENKKHIVLKECP